MDMSRTLYVNDCLHISETLGFYKNFDFSSSWGLKICSCDGLLSMMYIHRIADY